MIVRKRHRQAANRSDTGHIAQTYMEDSELNLKSERIILDVMLDEYTKEHDRKVQIDNKAGAFIAASIAILAIFIPAIPYQAIISCMRQSCRPHDAVTIFLAVLIISAFLIALALYNLYKAYNVKDIGRPEIDAISATEKMSENEASLFKELIAHYRNIINENQSLNNQKAASLKVGLGMTIVAFFLMLMAVVVLKFLTL